MQPILKQPILFFLLIISESVMAQRDLEMVQTKPNQEPIIKPIITPTIDSTDTIPKVWTLNADLGINLSFSSNNNQPDGTSQDGFSTTNTIDLSVKYEKRKVEMTNELHWQFSLHQSGDNKSNVIKSSDALLTLHDWSFGVSNKNRWNINLISKINTSIFTIFEGGLLQDTSDAQKYPVQKFLNPYDATFSPGIKYQPNDYLRVSFAPFSYRFYGTLDQQIADQGLYNTQYNEDSTHIVKNMIEKQGAELNVWYDRDFSEWVVLQYRINISSNYDENIFKNGNVNGLFITKVRIFNGFYLSHHAIVRGSLGESPFKPQIGQVVTLSYGKTF